MENWILRVTGIVPEATDIKTIFLQRRSGEPIIYEAGQFLTLLFSFRGHPLRRSYSFSTTPEVDPVPGITVKRVPNGEISRHLLDHLRVGDALTTLPPAGRFMLDAMGESARDVAGDVVFIAAGSGVVPVFSLLKAARAARPGVRLRVLTQQHDEASSPFRGAMAEMGLEWTENLTVREGRLTKDRLEEWVRTARVVGSGAYVFLCAPFDFMRMTQIVLRTMGVADDRIRREHFTVGHIPPAPPVFDATPKKVLVRGSVGREFVVTWPDSILTAAIRQGIPLPYSCRAGRCSSCVAHCLRGRVRMTRNEVLTDKDLAEGLVLTCVGYAETDVELDYTRSSATNAMGSKDPE
jgi:ring-1,2-phenylacetyl-CoA epoxidase subunit PaaE